MFGPGDEPEARRPSGVGRRVERDVVGHEAPGGGEPLDDRVAPVLDDELERVVDLGPHVVVAVRDLGERARDVPLREARGDARAGARACAASSRTSAREELRLARRAALLGVRELVGEGVELVAREALAASRWSACAATPAGALSTCARVTSMYQPKTRV